MCAQCLSEMDFKTLTAKDFSLDAELGLSDSGYGEWDTGLLLASSSSVSSSSKFKLPEIPVRIQDQTCNLWKKVSRVHGITNSYMTLEYLFTLLISVASTADFLHVLYVFLSLVIQIPADILQQSLCNDQAAVRPLLIWILHDIPWCNIVLSLCCQWNNFAYFHAKKSSMS